jgi:tRNA (guanine37-N1)-methyltransferase
MMRIDILSAVPSSMQSYIESSILKIANEKKLAEIYIHNLHDFTKNPKHRIDDYPFGGGAGMLIKCEPVFNLVEKLKSERDYDEVVFMSADGEIFNQSIANGYSLKENIIIISGHYKGIDQRIRDEIVTKEISLGDFVLTGGELPALVFADAVIRLIPGVIGDTESALLDSHMDGLLEAPQYTRPSDFRGHKVPEVLLGGNHKKIVEWRQEKSLEKTKKRRPDLL